MEIPLKSSTSLTQDKSCVYVFLSGGLGNQLFQIANGYAYSLRYNKNFFVSKDWNGRPDRPPYWNSLLQNLQPYLKDISEFKGTEYREPRWSYTPIPFIEGDVILKGYFQSEKYFEDFREEVRKLFNIYPDNLQNNNVAVHIRRGDYLHNPDLHTILEKEYYDKAKELIETKIGKVPNYIYFSDDIEWVKNTFKNDLKQNDTIVSGLPDYEEFKRMLNCTNFILANSTFGWWASWFSKSNFIIAPEKWFGPQFIESWKDIYRSNFNIIRPIKTVAVTMFFDLKSLPDATPSVRDIDFYLEHGKTVLSIKQPLVIFCDSITQPKLKQLRNSLCPDLYPDDTMYIIKNITEYDFYSLNHKIIKENRRKSNGYKDPNDRNTPSYFIATMFKFLAVKIAKEYINASYYAWIDFGCSHVVDRAAEFIPKMLETPHPKLACTYIHYRPHTMIDNMESYLEYFNPCGIAAGIWTIEKDLVDLFYTRTMNIFYEQLSKGVGHSEEGVLVYLYDRYPEMFTLNYGDYYSLLSNYHNVIRDYNTVKYCFIEQCILNNKHDLAETCAKKVLRSIQNGSLSLPEEEIHYLKSKIKNNIKICYVILSCDAYKNTRNQWQKNTWIKNIENDPNSDYYFLYANMGENRHCVGWGTSDDYESCPVKYKEFIKHKDLFNFDYIFFCDDDTYVFHNRLKNYLSNFDKTKKLIIGRHGLFEDKIVFMSGGGGFALSSDLYKYVQQYIQNEYDTIPILRPSDVTMGLWIQILKEKYPDIEYHFSNLIPSDNHFRSPGYFPESSLTFHYVNEELFNFYSSLDF